MTKSSMGLYNEELIEWMNGPIAIPQVPLRRHMSPAATASGANSAEHSLSKRAIHGRTQATLSLRQRAIYKM